ncbi:MAG: GNAT family N-acetyltransferase [Clostridia bacterium]|nr:GNAT family N-acetyltransferase [Clostridia bacterium]
MKPIGTKPIATQRLLLRPQQPSDAGELVAAHSLAMTVDEAKRTVAAMIEEGSKPFAFHWTITLEGHAIGRIKGWEVNPYNGYIQLGYDIGPDYRCKGYMTEAVSAVIRYLLEQAEANRVYCSVRENNTASCRVCEKAGMTHEGTMRQHYARQDGGYDDVRIYGIVKSDLTKGEE